MPVIRVEQKNSTSIIKCDEGSNLLKTLHGNGFDIYSPCGGKGTCGKCKVHFKGVGQINSCKYTVDKDIDIILPEERETFVLVDQHKFTRPLSLKPGSEVKLSSNPHGVAIDIGTTTLAFYLVNLKTGTLLATRASLNPQTKYGADVITRINHTAQNPEGLQQLQKEILGAINQQLEYFAEFSEIQPSDIIKITIAGNTTMLHLLLGIDPLPIALVPFKPAFIDEQNLTADQLQVHCHPKARIKVLPSVAAYIGSDIVGGLASINPPEEIKRFLFIDIGTNGEMALVTPEKIWCCSTAAGPAFEGANISCGMGAVEGAINIFGDEGYNVIGHTDPQGLCGSGLVDVAAWLIKKNIVNKDGLLPRDFPVVAGSTNNKGVILTQQDIRELQLAKSAIMSGIKGLLRKATLEADHIDALFLAGGFGSYIDIGNAVKIGMLPPEMLNKTIPLGNTSAAGAFLSLISEEFDNYLNDIRQRSNHFELSEDEDFMLDFVMNMSF